jgi:hypothetical protein
LHRKHALIVLRTVIALEKHARKSGWDGPPMDLKPVVQSLGTSRDAMNIINNSSVCSEHTSTPPLPDRIGKTNLFTSTLPLLPPSLNSLPRGNNIKRSDSNNSSSTKISNEPGISTSKPSRSRLDPALDKAPTLDPSLYHDPSDWVSELADYTFKPQEYLPQLSSATVEMPKSLISDKLFDESYSEDMLAALSFDKISDGSGNTTSTGSTQRVQDGRAERLGIREGAIEEFVEGEVGDINLTLSKLMSIIYQTWLITWIKS